MTIKERIERLEKHVGFLSDPQPLTVIDPATGLMWEAVGSSDELSWTGAHEYADALNNCGFGGYTDWRLPTIHELFTLVDHTKKCPCIKDLPGIRCQPNCYWSSTTYADDTDFAWAVGFYRGHVSSYGTTFEFYVRCVRGS